MILPPKDRPPQERGPHVPSPRTGEPMRGLARIHYAGNLREDLEAAVAKRKSGLPVTEPTS